MLEVRKIAQNNFENGVHYNNGYNNEVVESLGEHELAHISLAQLALLVQHFQGSLSQREREGERERERQKANNKEEEVFKIPTRDTECQLAKIR